MNFKLQLAVILGAFVVFVVGYSRVAYAAPPNDACSLLTPAQVSAALGISVPAGTHLNPVDTKNSVDTKTCGWPAWPKSAVPPIKRATLTILGPNEFVSMKMPVPAKGVVKTPVKGVGDDAVYITTGGTLTALTVKKGKVAFEVRVYGSTIEQVKAAEKTLAEDIVAKL